MKHNAALAQLKVAGQSLARSQLLTVIDQYIAKSQTIEGAASVLNREILRNEPLRRELCRFAVEMRRNGGGIGPSGNALDGPHSFADPSPSIRDGGAILAVPNTGHLTPAPSSRPNRERDGLRDRAARGGRDTTALPAREPTRGQVAAATVAKLAAAKSVLDSFKLRDGRSIGAVYIRELDALETENSVEAAVLRQVRRHAHNMDPNSKVRDVIKEETLEGMIKRATELVRHL